MSYVTLHNNRVILIDNIDQLQVVAINVVICIITENIGLKDFTIFKNNNVLQLLICKNNNLNSLNGLNTCKQLLILECINCNLKTLSGLEFCSQSLKFLNLSNNNLSNIDINILLSLDFNNLKYLNIKNNNIDRFKLKNIKLIID